MRGWDKNLPGRILGALPKRKWVRRLQRPGQELLIRLWHHVADKSPATRSRWQWTWVADDSVFKKSGQQLGLVGTWYSGQEHRVRLGIDGLLLLVVIGEGTLVVPVDFVVRRPDPVGPGGPCRDKLTWLQVMLDRTWAALQRRCRQLPAPVVVADSWFGDSGLLSHVATVQQGTLVVEGKTSYTFQLSDGQAVKGHALRSRAWRRRSAIEHTFRTLKHLLATEACQVTDEDAYYGHLVLRLLAGLVLLYTARVILKGRVTMEEIIFSLKHHWRFLHSEPLELQALSWDLPIEAA